MNKTKYRVQISSGVPYVTDDGGRLVAYLTGVLVGMYRMGPVEDHVEIEAMEKAADWGNTLHEKGEDMKKPLPSGDMIHLSVIGEQEE